MTIQPITAPASPAQAIHPSSPPPVLSPQCIANGSPPSDAAPARDAGPCAALMRGRFFDALSAASPMDQQRLLRDLGPGDDRRLGLLVALACSPALTAGRGIALAMGPPEGDLDHVLLNDQSDPLRLHVPDGWPGIDELADMLESRVVTDVLGSADGTVTDAVRGALAARLADALVSRRSEMDQHWATVAARQR